MSTTLKEYQDSIQEKYDVHALVDVYRHDSSILENLPFDDTAALAGTSFVYAYDAITSENTAGFRAVGADFQTTQAKIEKRTASLAICGNKYKVDRAIAKFSANKLADNVKLNAEKSAKAGVNKFHDAFINGDTTQEAYANGFDGLNKLLKGKETEFTSQVDVSTSAKMDENYTAFMDEIDGVIASVVDDGGYKAICVNSKTKAKLVAMAKRATQYQTTTNDLGQTIEKYGDWEIVDMKKTMNNVADIIPVKEDGTSDIYFVSFSLDGFHGICPDGDMILAEAPDFKTNAAAQVEGYVELYAGIALKNTNNAAVLRNVKVAPVTAG
jgi:hypothetical protein